MFTNRRFVSGKSYVNNDDNINYGARSCKSLSCKDIRIHSFHHMHARTHAHARTHTRTRVTNTCITGDGLVEWEERKQQINMQKRRDGFSVLT